MDMFSDSFRTRLRDIMFGRPKIAVVSEEKLNESAFPPIFLVGTFRSGTTLMRYFLDSHNHICCPPETKFLLPLAQMFKDKSILQATESLGFDEFFLCNQCRIFANKFFDAYRVAKNKARWADKTPEYVRILDFIEELYGPACQYVILYRNGLDVAHSMNTTFIEPLEPDKTLEKAFEYWKQDTEIMHAWEQAHAERCFVIRYESLCHDLVPTLEKLFQFLHEPWDEGVLRWYEKGHDRGCEDIKARRQRKIKISHGNFKDWDKSVIENFKNRSRELHEAIGYDPELLLPRETPITR